MIAFFKSLVVAGEELDAHRRRYVVNTNVYALSVILFSLPYPFIYLYLHVDIDPLALWGSVLFILAYATVPFFNRLKVYTLAKLLFFITALVQLFIICVFFGQATGLDQFFYAAFIGVFFVMDRHQKILIIPALVVIVAEYILLHLIYAHFAPVIKVEPETATIIHHLTSVAVFLLLGLQCLFFYWGNLRAEENLEEARRQSDRLLLNILPEPIADELKEKGTVEPVEHDSVTVVFTDFVGFTSSSEFRNPVDLLKDLDDCFSAFDAIIEKHGLEKLKTIGDAYMFAGGVPTDLVDNATRCVAAAIEIIAYVKKRREENNRFWQIRVGIHTGHLIAGVIGRKKFIYDVWGDTVNTASRLESSGEPGRINISHATYDLVKEKFRCTPRGEIPVKGKGPLAMYFVDV
ncbi:MAG: Adenylate cyclase [Turneriella sp.]|nr:Adenylate cyclase [Turneriella sp.]